MSVGRSVQLYDSEEENVNVTPEDVPAKTPVKTASPKVQQSKTQQSKTQQSKTQQSKTPAKTSSPKIQQSKTPAKTSSPKPDDAPLVRKKPLTKSIAGNTKSGKFQAGARKTVVGVLNPEDVDVDTKPDVEDDESTKSDKSSGSQSLKKKSAQSGSNKRIQKESTPPDVEDEDEDEGEPIATLIKKPASKISLSSITPEKSVATNKPAPIKKTVTPATKKTVTPAIKKGATPATKITKSTVEIKKDDVASIRKLLDWNEQLISTLEEQLKDLKEHNQNLSDILENLE